MATVDLTVTENDWVQIPYKSGTWQLKVIGTVKIATSPTKPVADIGVEYSSYDTFRPFEITNPSDSAWVKSIKGGELHLVAIEGFF